MMSKTPSPARPQGRSLRLSRGPVHILEEGKGPAIFLIHGLPGSSTDFRHLSPHLAKVGFWVIGIDLPGFGLTPRNTFPLVEREHQVEFLAELATALGLQSFSILGHSFGGSLAMCTAARLPGRVKVLALINSIGRKRHHVLPPIPRGIFRVVARAMTAPLLEGPLVHSTRSIYKKMGLPHHFEGDDFAFHTRLMSSLHFSDHEEALERLRCPALVVSAENDPFIEREVSFDLAAALPDRVRHCHLHYRKGGHYLQKHRASEIATHLAALHPTLAS